MHNQQLTMLCTQITALYYNLSLRRILSQGVNIQMKATATIVFIYGLLIFIGGLMGFIKGGSQASLVSGIVFGVALLTSAYLIFKGKLMAQYFALGFTFLLDALFTYRYAKTLHFFPTGFLSLVSLAVLIVIALKVRKTLKS